MFQIKPPTSITMLYFIYIGVVTGRNFFEATGISKALSNSLVSTWPGCRPQADEPLYVLVVEVRRYPLVLQHSHGKSMINGGFNGRIIYKCAIFHCYVQ